MLHAGVGVRVLATAHTSRREASGAIRSNVEARRQSGAARRQGPLVDASTHAEDIEEKHASGGGEQQSPVPERPSDADYEVEL